MPETDLLKIFEQLKVARWSMSMAETQLVLRHNLELSNPASASCDLDPVGAASITSPRDGRFDDTVRSF
jgi:hypothetical protein